MVLAGKSISRTFILSPFIGVVLFLILYVVATIFYPGGSQADMNATGFSWICIINIGLYNRAVHGIIKS
jgi:uncharacterized membrane protein YfhO